MDRSVNTNVSTGLYFLLQYFSLTFTIDLAYKDTCL
jgi:hypothetical protein